MASNDLEVHNDEILMMRLRGNEGGTGVTVQMNINLGNDGQLLSGAQSSVIERAYNHAIDMYQQQAQNYEPSHLNAGAMIRDQVLGPIRDAILEVLKDDGFPNAAIIPNEQGNHFKIDTEVNAYSFTTGADDGVDGYSINNEEFSLNKDGTVTMNFAGKTQDGHPVEMTVILQADVLLVDGCASWTEEQRAAIENTHDALNGHFQQHQVNGHSRSDLKGYAGEDVARIMTNKAAAILESRGDDVGLGSVAAVDNVGVADLDFPESAVSPSLALGLNVSPG